MGIEDHVIHLENGRLADDTPPEKVRQMVEAATQHQPNGLVVHFHGGLVNYASGMATAEALCERYLEAGSYPIFFVWESGLIETIRNNLGDIAQEEIFGILWKRLANVVLRKAGQSGDQRAAGELPQVDDSSVQEAINEAIRDGTWSVLADSEATIRGPTTQLSPIEALSLENELSVDGALMVAVEEVSNGLRTPQEVEAELESRSATVRASTASLIDPTAIHELVQRPDPTSRGVISTAAIVRAIVKIAGSTISRFISNRDHGFHATLIEEILRGLYVANVGGFIWTQMKQDTRDAFGQDAEAHGGTAFLKYLQDSQSVGLPPRITLVGHSTGAVYVSEFVHSAAQLLSDEMKFGVILEAPASTFDKLAATLKDHSARISGFRVFTMSDQYERADKLVPFLYPHSLLYFVSGVVEDEPDTPIVGMNRFYDLEKFPSEEFLSVSIVRDYVEESRDRIVWSKTLDSVSMGMKSGATSHSAFDDEDEWTIESVKHILAEGF